MVKNTGVVVSIDVQGRGTPIAKVEDARRYARQVWRESAPPTSSEPCRDRPALRRSSFVAMPSSLPTVAQRVAAFAEPPCTDARARVRAAVRRVVVVVPPWGSE